MQKMRGEGDPWERNLGVPRCFGEAELLADPQGESLDSFSKTRADAREKARM